MSETVSNTNSMAAYIMLSNLRTLPPPVIIIILRKFVIDFV